MIGEPAIESPVGTVIATEVTVPLPLLLKVFQSVEVKYPLTEVVAAGIDIVFVVLTNGLENVKALSLLLKVDQSVELNAPRFVALAVGTFKVITGVVVPVATVLDKSVPLVPNVKAATDVTVPTLQVLSALKS